MTGTKIAIFKGKQIRKTIYKNEWWFSVIDVVEALTGTERPRKYWNDLKKKLAAEGYRQVSEKIGQLKLAASQENRPKGLLLYVGEDHLRYLLWLRLAL